MARASAFLDPRLSEYLVAHAQPRDPLLTELAAETRRLYPELDLQVSPDEGALLRMLVRISGARRAIELGTFTGYSSICIAQGLAPGGRLLCCEVSPEWTAVARRFWDLAGLTDRIELHLGPALRIVAGLPAEPRFDFAFIDAEKAEYIDYYEAVVPRMARGGLIAVDNTLRHGKAAGVGEPDARTRVIRAFNDHVLADSRTESVIVPIADGLTLATVTT
ncbi:MAG: O-methyltransferase [Candidatus Dormibacteria bacterium]|jgi:caffeoyl-CoA O-methyltransferase